MYKNEQVKEWHRQYREKNRERINARVRRWYKENSHIQKQWRARNPEKVKQYQANRIRPKYSKELYTKTRSSRLKSAKKYAIKTKYGLLWEEYLKMVEESGGRCNICKKEVAGFSLHIDHDHKARKVRGLLCNACNVCLGAIDADREWGIKALAYLEKQR